MYLHTYTRVYVRMYVIMHAWYFRMIDQVCTCTCHRRLRLLQSWLPPVCVTGILVHSVTFPAPALRGLRSTPNDKAPAKILARILYKTRNTCM
jgi:hypothetical protein